MAYDQGHYQPPQRPYTGRAAQRPGPPQGFSQPTAPQQYPPQQQYGQYAQDDYGYDDYNNGYAQDYNGSYQDMNGGGRGNAYPPPNQHNQGYPPQQEYYGNDRGGNQMPPPRAASRGPPPIQRPPPMDNGRGGFDPRGGQGGRGRGYPNGGPVGRGGGARPPPLDRAGSSDPGPKQARKPLKTPPISPDVPAWDNPFPTFPGTKKKTSISEEQKIVQNMDNMNIGGASQGRPRTAGSRNGDRFPNGGRGPPTDDYGRPSMDGQRRGPPADDYGRPSGESQRGMPPRGYAPQGPPQQAYPDRRGPPPGPGFGGPRQNAYAEPAYDDRGRYGAEPNFVPPSRSMTMPNDPPLPMGRQAAMDPGPSAPYNGPVGRAIPPRPATATGARPPPQRTYPAPAPVQQLPPVDPYAYDDGHGSAYRRGHQANESISEFYDSYYDDPDPNPRQSRPISGTSVIPNFDSDPGQSAAHKRGVSIDNHIAPQPQPTGYQQVKPANSQADFRAQAQPQAAVFEMAGDAPPMPNYTQQGYDDGYGGQNGYSQPPGNQRPPPQQGYRSYDDPPPQNGFQPPPRSASAAPRPPPVGPKPGFQGLPNGPANGSVNGLPNGPTTGNLPRANTTPNQKPLSPDALPSHPPPVRAGLIPNSVAAQAANTKPTPVRNYNNVPSGTAVAANPQQTQQTPPAQQPANAPESGNSGPVTMAELGQLQNAVKTNPNDQKTSMILARKLVEASETIVPKLADPKMRTKTREKYILDAHKLLKKLVAASNPDAMFYLADCHGRGALGLETDNKEAFILYQHAAKIGHPAAAYRTAVCCELGNEDGGGTKKDPLKAIQWYKRAAMLGDTPAMYKMGMIQLKGLLGQPKNIREAVGWLKRAAERCDPENPHALHELGLLYEQPQSTDNTVVRDETYAFQLYHQAAALGYKFSQFKLGSSFEYGLLGCPIDPRQSIMWYSKAAQQEEHQSELALSGWYLTGSEGVLQQSDTEAYLWARKAAIAGLSKAEYAMGYFTEVGIGSPANLEDAKRWYWRAASQNFPKARERLEELKRNGGKAGPKSRDRISRSKVGKQNEGECSVM